MTINVNKTLIDQLAIVILTITSWSGRTKIQPEDLRGDLSGIPPAEIASLGTLKYLDPQKLQGLATLRASAYRECLAVGTRFLGGYAIPLDKADELMARLEIIKDKYDQLATEILRERDQLVQHWADQNAEWSEVILAAASRATARQHPPEFRVTPFVLAPAACAPQALQAAVEELPGTLLDEIAQEAKLAYEGSFKGRTECTAKSLNVLSRLREKLWGLRFISADALKVMADIDDVLGKLPASGPYQAGAYQAIVALVLRLANKDIRDIDMDRLFGAVAQHPTVPVSLPVAAPTPLPVSVPTPAPAPQTTPTPPAPPEFTLSSPAPVVRPRERRSIW